MAKTPSPESSRQPPSAKATRADPFLYGGAASIVGILGLIIGAAYALVGNASVGAILAGLGAVLLVVGFLVARRGA